LTEFWCFQIVVESYRSSSLHSFI